MPDHGSSRSIDQSSPSSVGADSLRGTPGTKVTEFSPEDVRGEPKADKGIGKANFPPTFSLQGVPVKTSPSGKVTTIRSIASYDPFTTGSGVLTVNGNPSAGIKLSPTAAAFKPLQSTTQSAVINANHPGFPDPDSIGVLSVGQQTKGTSTVSYLNATSVPDLHPHRKITENLFYISAGLAQPPIAPPAHTHSSVTPKGGVSAQALQFAGTLSSRYLKVSNVPKVTSQKNLCEIFSTQGFAHPKMIVITNLSTDGVIYVQFVDLRDAQDAYMMLKNKSTWIAQYVSPKHFIVHFIPDDLAKTSDFEGQLTVTVLYVGQQRDCDAQHTAYLVKDLLENYGGLASYDCCALAFPVFTFRAEFYDVNAADLATRVLNGYKIASLSITVELYNPDVTTPADPSVQGNQGPLILGRDDGLDHAMAELGVNEAPRRPIYATYGPNPTLPSVEPASSFTTATTAVMGSNGYQTPQSSAGLNVAYSAEFPLNACGQPLYGYQQFGMPMVSLPAYNLGAVGQQRLMQPVPRPRVGPVLHHQRSSPKTGSRQNLDHPSGHHNVVDIERIRQGVDVRTTIMLRNIPNKIDQAMLKEIVDDTSRGKYDFMYLRIDFANNCNVGYAFINFEDPYHIIDFVKARAGHRWNRFNSDKVAEVSYATIQGKDCLVQKFRNSSVMLEHHSFRPKIFHTGGTMTGEEEAFPGPDNPSKMRRSVENAEHVGLFAPRAGQHFRDEQRRRRSQYDRGTRLAEIEDSYGLEEYDTHVNANHQRYGGPGYSYQGVMAAPYRGYQA